MQTEFDGCFRHYIHEGPHQCRNMNGRTPYTVFLEGLFPFKESEADEDMEAA